MTDKGFHHYFRHWPHWLRVVIGLLLIAAGIFGIIMPIIPGWIFLIPGILLVLGEESRHSKWIMAKLHMLHEKWDQRKQPKP